MALNFLAICLLAVLGGPWPAIFASFVAIGARIYFVVYDQRTPVLPLDMLRGVFLVMAAIVVGAVLESRRRAQQASGTALAALNEHAQALVDSLHAGKCASWVLDLDSGSSARWYKGSYQVFGRPFEELEARPSLGDLIDEEDKPRFPALVQHMKTSQEPAVFEHRTTWPNGELHWLEMRATRVPGAGCIWRGVTVDITERKLAEATLLRQEKLAAMGRLASTVAHEINNPLEAVTNLLYLARTDTALSDETRMYLATAENELARLGDITRLTLGFVRNQSTRRSLRLEAVVEEVLAIFRHRYELKNIQIERRMDPSVAIEIAPHELRQILTNLISNAADALTGSDPMVLIEIRSEGETGVFVLEDNGSGISEAALNRVFEPFFTTKADIGTGIGLWVTRELVEKNGGRVTVESGELDNGMKTRFRVELPLAPGTHVAVPHPEAVAAV
jgi:PAS domain S-box-containing protein